MDHARENNNANYNPVSELLAKDPNFIKTKKEILSFAAFSTNQEDNLHRLSGITDGLERSVCISAREPGIPDLLTGAIYPFNKSQTEEIEAEMGVVEWPDYKDFDLLIFSSQEQQNNLPIPSKATPNIPGPFLKTDVTEKEKRKLGHRIYVGSEMKEIGELFAAEHISDKDLAKLIHTINEVGKPAAEQMKETFSKPNSLVFVSDINSLDGRIDGVSESTKARSLLADALPSCPTGSCLMVDMPLIFKPVIDRSECVNDFETTLNRN